MDDDPFDSALTGYTAADAANIGNGYAAGDTTPTPSTNWLSTLTGLTGLATSVYGAVKAPSVTTSVAASTSNAFSKIAPWLIGGVVVFFVVKLFRK